jgi:hypothetical protein
MGGHLHTETSYTSKKKYVNHILYGSFYMLLNDSLMMTH